MRHTRRNFIQTSVAAVMASQASALAMGSPQAPSNPASTGPLPLSLMSYSFYGLQHDGKMDVFGLLESCRYRYGLHACDLWSVFLTSLEDGYLKKVREAFDEREMVCPVFAVDLVNTMSGVWASDAERRDLAHNTILAYLKAATILGAKFVRIDAGGASLTAKSWTDEEFDYIVRRYKEYCQFAQDNGFRMGPEVHWGPETAFPNMKRLFEAVDHPGFGLLHHLNKFDGTPEEKAVADKEAAKWACGTHIEWSVAVNRPVLIERMNFLRDAGYRGYYSPEHHSGRNEYAEVEVQLANVRQVLDSWRTGGTGVASGDMTGRGTMSPPPGVPR